MNLRQNNNSNITDIGISYVASSCHYLREIDVLYSAGVTDIGLQEIAKGIKDIQLLGLGGAVKSRNLGTYRAYVSIVTDVGLLALAETCHSLNFLNVRGATAATDVGAVAIAKGCAIRSFYTNTSHIVSGFFSIQNLRFETDATILALAQRPMQNIGIYGNSKITSSAVQKLVDISPGLLVSEHRDM